MTDDQIKELALYKQRLDFYHAEDRHECTLIHYRMLWMLTFQGILLAGFFALKRAGLGDDIWRQVIPASLGVCSVFLAVRIGIAIKAAEDIIAQWHTKEGKLFDEDFRIYTDNVVKNQLEWYSIAAC